MADLKAKAGRIAGTFTLMLGAGIVLDTHALEIGTALILLGAGMLLWGLLEGRPHGKVEAPAEVHEGGAKESIR